jgi:hypothetical protein
MKDITKINSHGCDLSGGTIVSFGNQMLTANGGNGGVKRKTYNVNIPAGEYRVQVKTWDYHSTHGGQNQKREQVHLRYQVIDPTDSDGLDTIAKSGATTDIPENQDGQITTVSNTVVLNQNVTRLTVEHDDAGSGSIQSVYAACAKFVKIDNIPTSDPLTVSCNVSDTSVETGDSVTFSANADGGNSPYTYSWNSGIANTQSGTVVFNDEGYYNATVTVTDSYGNTASDTCPTVVVDDDEPDDDDLRIRCEVSDTTIEEGDRVTYSVDILEGSGPFDYEWDGDIEGEDDDDSSIRVEYDYEGSYRAEVTVWDNNGNRASDDCPTVYVDEDDDDDDLRIRCEVSDTTIEEGDRITISVDIDGGDSPYDIEWSGDIDDIDDFEDDERSQRVEIEDAGRYYIEVEVTDDDGNRDTDDCPVIRVSEEDDDDGDINVFTNSRPSGNLAGLNSVLLSQVPYTGPAEDAAVILGYTLLLLLWSAIITLFFYKRYQKNLQSKRIQAFKEANRTA